ncbi:MAG TPA: phosphoadenylyl-sulfate reductase [Bryobacteraceae bacterium]|jgi:phosphoadenosine phosphosulfate reductase
MSLIENAQTLIRESLAASPGQPCVTSSFQADCVALVDLIVAERPDIPVLFLDTGYHFDETYAYRDDIAERLHLNVQNLRAAQTVADQESQLGILYETAPDRCCGLRKVEPLFTGLSNYDTWFTALRRDQSPTRANLQESAPFALPNGRMIQKVSPLAAWTMKDVWHYLKSRNLPVMPLYDKGYTSIGCAPCTALPTLEGGDRSGRWGGKKLECGIHIQAPST